MSGVYFEKKFWSDVAERAIRAFVTSSLALFAADNVSGVVSIDVTRWLNISGFAVLVSVLTSMAAQKFGDDSASFVG